MQSLEQSRSARFNAAYKRRNIGGASAERLAEAYSLDAVSEWFESVYNQLDKQIEDAFINNQTDKQATLHNLRATMRDYEPRKGDDLEAIATRMEQLYMNLRKIADSGKLTGALQGYISKVAGQVKRVALAGVELPSVEEPEDKDFEGELGGSEIGGEGGDEEIEVPEEGEEEEGGEFPEEEFPVPAESVMKQGGTPLMEAIEILRG